MKTQNIVYTNSDCLFNGHSFDVSLFPQLNSKDLQSIVGEQSPNGYAEDLSETSWSFEHIKIDKLKYATEYYEEPSNGWINLYLQFLKEDEKAAKFTPEYAGRDLWIKNVWSKNTSVYPLFVILEDSHYRLLDGHHRLAGAFYYQLQEVAIILGQKL